MTPMQGRASTGDGTMGTADPHYRGVRMGAEARRCLRTRLLLLLLLLLGDLLPTHFFFVFDLKKLLEQEGGPNPRAPSYSVGSVYRPLRDVGVVVVRMLWTH